MIKQQLLVLFMGMLFTNSVISQPPVVPFEEEDIVEPYRHFDAEQGKVVNGSEQGKEGTKWKVVEITEDHIRLELAEGIYKPWWDHDVVYKSGEYSDEHFNSESYLEKFPNAGNNEQIFKTHRKIK